MDLISKNRIFAWECEGDETRYFINGVYLGANYDFLHLFEAALSHLVIGKPYLIKKIWFNDLDKLSEAEQNKVADFLDTVEIISMEQERALYSKDFENLLKLI